MTQNEHEEGQKWEAREFTDKERNHWLFRKGEWDWLLISPDGVQFGPMLEVTARGLQSILIGQSLIVADHAAARDARRLGDRVRELEPMAEAVHQAYLDTCARLGWPVKPANQVPYTDLEEDSKELDRASVRAVLAYLLSSPPVATEDKGGEG